MGCVLAILATEFVLYFGLMVVSDRWPLLVGAASVSIVGGFVVRSGCALVKISIAGHAAFLAIAVFDSPDSFSRETPATIVLAFILPLVWFYVAEFTWLGMLIARGASGDSDDQRSTSQASRLR